MDVLEQFLTGLHHAVVGPSHYSVSVVVHSSLQRLPEVPEVQLDQPAHCVEGQQRESLHHPVHPHELLLDALDVGRTAHEVSVPQVYVLLVVLLQLRGHHCEWLEEAV